MEDFSKVSPFEFKDVLIKMAQDSCAKALARGDKKARVLNAGRGNPNFLNPAIRHGFHQLHRFAVDMSEEQINAKLLGMRPLKEGIAKRLEEYCRVREGEKGISFLQKAVKYAVKHFEFLPDEFVFEITDAVLGDFYPMPPRIFPHNEVVTNQYLKHVLSTDDDTFPKGNFDLFATEGATMSMVYLFRSLKENKILHDNDKIAIMTPIFTPYLEIPELNDYNLVEVKIEADPNLNWQFPDTEIQKLKDPDIKALFLVNPTNPASMSIQKRTLKQITKLIKEDRQDLIILTDTVYSMFTDSFRSLVYEVPQNTIGVYSYSKYFGVTGWRLGVIMLHEDNIIDKMIANLPDEDKKEIHKRYHTHSPEPEKIKFIDRLEIDSRDVALAHTGGLSGPQQVMMTFCSLCELMDTKQMYKAAVRKLLKKRFDFLQDNLGISIPAGPHYAYYYVLMDLLDIARQKHGDEFAKHLEKSTTLLQFMLTLAKDKQTICLPAVGFGASDWSFRISLANLRMDAYIDIGKNLADLLQEYYDKWQRKTKS